MGKNSSFYDLTVRYGRRFAEMYLALGDDEVYMNKLRKAILMGKFRLGGRGYHRKPIIDRCYMEQRRKHKSKRKWAKK